jgi:hypothetical protein
MEQRANNPFELVRNGHEIVPVPGTYKRASDGKPLDPPIPWNFPITADCEECGQPAQKNSSLFSDWYHAQ